MTMATTVTTARRHRVAIVGCGFGGLFAAKRLRRADVTVIDRANHHLFQPLLYPLATGIVSEGDIALPVRDVLRHQRPRSVETDFNANKTRKEEYVHVTGKRIDVEGVGAISCDGARRRSWRELGSPELRASGR